MNDESPRRFVVDFGRQLGPVRPLNGVNLGPLAMNGMLDLTAAHRELKVPLTRLHDVPYIVQDTVDVHHIVRNREADPDDPANYTFTRTDAYIQSILETGSQIVYRLGESIDHFRSKTFIHPPADVEKYATVCANIARHYNYGWADGFRYGIPYWEIWNEPNNPPCWSGTMEQFCQLYEAIARKLKALDPSLQVGGCGMAGDSPCWEQGLGFLEYCARRDCPLDFFSWHIYTSQPAKVVERARCVRRLLDDHGLTDTKSHLNEWNYLAGDSWAVQLSGDPVVRRDSFENQLGGAPGGAFTAAVLMLLQGEPVDELMYYFSVNGWWGLYDTYGVPTPAYHVLRAFARLREMPTRVAAEGSDAEAGLAVCAALRPKDSALVLLSNLQYVQDEYEVDLKHLPWDGAIRSRAHMIDARREPVPLPPVDLPRGKRTLRVALPPQTVCLLELQPRLD